MTNEQEGIGALVVTDQSGNYYVIDREVIDRARVPDEHKAEVEQLVGSGDTSGFMGSAGLRRLSSLQLVYVMRPSQMKEFTFMRMR